MHVSMWHLGRYKQFGMAGIKGLVLQCGKSECGKRTIILLKSFHAMDQAVTRCIPWKVSMISESLCCKFIMSLSPVAQVEILNLKKCCLTRSLYYFGVVLRTDGEAGPIVAVQETDDQFWKRTGMKLHDLSLLIILSQVQRMRYISLPIHLPSNFPTLFLGVEQPERPEMQVNVKVLIFNRHLQSFSVHLTQVSSTSYEAIM